MGNKQVRISKSFREEGSEKQQPSGKFLVNSRSSKVNRTEVEDGEIIKDIDEKVGVMQNERIEAPKRDELLETIQQPLKREEVYPSRENASVAQKFSEKVRTESVQIEWDQDVLEKLRKDMASTSIGHTRGDSELSESAKKNLDDYDVVETVEWDVEDDGESDHEEDESEEDDHYTEDLEESASQRHVTPEMRKKRLARYEIRCPPGGENDVVIYVTSLRGIRKTYAECNKVRMILQGLMLQFDERDVSFHSGYRTELTSLMGYQAMVPQLFIRGHYIGGADTVVRLNDEKILIEMVEGIPRLAVREQCEGCGDMRFVPCIECSGSHKIVYDDGTREECTECNENGLIHCPYCSNSPFSLLG